MKNINFGFLTRSECSNLQIVKNTLNNLSNDEKKKVHKVKCFMNQVSESHHESNRKFLSDIIIYKVLVDFGWNVKNSIERLIKTIKWRINYRPDLITIHETFEKMKSFPDIIFHYGHCKEGYPVIYIKMGNVYYIRKEFQLICKSIVYLLEIVNKKYYKCTVVIDAKNVGYYWTLKLLTMYGRRIKELTDNYNNILHKAYVVNASLLVRTIYNVGIQIMDKSSQEKFNIEKYCDGLCKIIDKEEIIEEFGGKAQYSFDLDEILKLEKLYSFKFCKNVSTSVCYSLYILFITFQFYFFWFHLL